MKKIIGIVFISLMFVNNGFAEMKLIEEHIMKSRIKNFKRNVVSTVCIDGYKFVINATTGGRSIVQFYEDADESDHYLIVPAKC